MRQLPPALAEHLASGTTTLCWCWRLVRRDGTQRGFTDHDRDLTFDGTVFEAASGFTASELKETLGLAADNVEIQGALSSDDLTEADLAAGLYDDARVEIWRVNWQAPDQRVRVKTGVLGEVRRTGRAFTAEVRGLSHRLQRPTGRLFQHTCDADLGDSRCRIDLNLPAYCAEGTVISLEGSGEIAVAGLDGYANGWFSRGLLTWISGDAAGARTEVRIHTRDAGGTRLSLWEPVPAGVALTDRFRVTAGCDKLSATCAAKFFNVVNFQGFPHMPGNAYVTSIARPGAKARGRPDITDWMR